MTRAALLAAAAAVFAILATANSGGYRYGVSDQAFYATAVVKDLHPSFFTRDTRLIATQARLMWSDEIVAGLSRLTGAELPTLSLVLYGVTVLGLFAGAIAFARAAGFSWWAVAGLLVLLTFRHRIAKTGANSLEGYMHPRELAFALGLLAFAAVLRLRAGWAIVWTALSACWHPTTAFWFAIAAGVAIAIAEPRARRWVWIGAFGGALAGCWAITLGPLAGHLVRMDPAWLSVLAEKDYLFPHEWPGYAWVVNLAYPLVIVLTFRRRRQRGVTARGEGALVTGLLILLAIFAVAVPLAALRIALAVQVQATRVFWLMDFVAAAYAAWWLTDAWPRSHSWARLAVLTVVTMASAGRGYYLVAAAQPSRQLIQRDLPETPWEEAMRWLRDQPASWHVLADPGHAWKYGVSVRLAAEKDTVLEAGKDTALAMYDRNVAMSVADRLTALRDFDRLTTADVRALDARYGLDAVVVETTRVLDLPELHRNSQFVIYGLR